MDPKTSIATAPLGVLNEVSETPIYECYVAARQSAALCVAVHIDLFSYLNESPRTVEEISKKYGFSIRGVDSLVLVLRYVKALRMTVDGKWTTTPESQQYLLKDSPQYLGTLIELEWEGFITPQSYLKSLKADSPLIYDGKDPWEAHEVDPAQAKKFTLAMHSISSRPALALAESFDFTPYSHILDVGGGSGVFLIAALTKYKHLFGTIYEIPAVVDIALDKMHEAGLEGRVGTVSGNFFKDELVPYGKKAKGTVVPKAKSFDVVLLSQILHDWGREKGQKLVKRCYDALPSGGALILHEKLMNDSKTGPLANISVNIDMVLWTEGQQFTSKELLLILKNAGFTSSKTIPTTSYWSIVVGYKE